MACTPLSAITGMLMTRCDDARAGNVYSCENASPKHRAKRRNDEEWTLGKKSGKVSPIEAHLEPRYFAGVH